MAKGYIIEEVHVTGGSIRLRDSLTGKVVDVPLTPGSKLMLSGEDGVDDGDPEESATDDDDEADAAAEEAEAEADDDADDAKPAARRRRRRKSRAKKAAERRANAEDVPALTVPRSRPVTEDPTPVVDESTLTDEDKAAVEQFRALMSKARGKRGGLGWQEITVDGRSGLQARWGTGQFKILHTGGDAYALFYEWDGGKYERIACGKADDLMRLAAARSEDEQPKAPLTTLTLEVARLFCGTPDQQDLAKTRLRPVRNPVEPEPEPEPLHSRAAKAPKRATAEPSAKDAPRPPADEATETEAKDQELLSSFSDELGKVLDEEDD